MTEFARTQPAGRMISRLFARVGWAIVIGGFMLALVGAALGRFPGTGGDGADEVSALARVLAALPGLGLALFGLFSVMMAAQTRAALDSADIAREMLVLARRRPISLLAAVPHLGTTGEERMPDIRGAASRGAASGEDAASEDVGGMAPMRADASRTTRFAAASPPAPTSPPRPEPPALPAGEARKEPRTEPVFAASARPKTTAGKVHPIFSARPPR